MKKERILKPGEYYIDGVWVRIHESLRSSMVKRMIRDIKRIERVLRKRGIGDFSAYFLYVNIVCLKLWIPFISMRNRIAFRF